MGTVSYLTIDGEIISETRSGVDSDYVPDSLGSTTALLNSSQTITDTWSYWPFGETQSRTGGNATPMEFAGTLGYHTDLVPAIYVRGRRLRVDLGRWQTLDPLWPDEDAYSYVYNSPSGAVDPSGLDMVSDPCHGQRRPQDPFKKPRIDWNRWWPYPPPGPISPPPTGPVPRPPTQGQPKPPPRSGPCKDAIKKMGAACKGPPIPVRALPTATSFGPD